jgi:hypothetical protein
MKEPRLDRSRFYAEVHPAGDGGVHFRQVCFAGDPSGGLPFDHEGRLVKARLTPQQIEELKKPEQPRSQKGAAASSPFSLDQLKALDALNLLNDSQKATLAQMQSGGDPPGGAVPGETERAGYKPPKSPAPGEEGGEGNVNLESWLKGEENFLFHRVKGAVFERFHRKFERQDDIVQFLVLANDGPHLVTGEQLNERFRKYLDGAAKD